MMPNIISQEYILEKITESLEELNKALDKENI